jgi:DinB superfamily
MESVIIDDLARNKDVFKSLLSSLTIEEYTYKSQPDKWCLLEIICHLYDEEREDFRIRTKHILEQQEGLWPSIDPQNWPSQRNYMQYDYEETIHKFLLEREKSIAWLRSFQNPDWDRFYMHPKVGKVPARLLLKNWLAHDYLHFRQITRTRYEYLKTLGSEPVDYAGEW